MNSFTNQTATSQSHSPYLGIYAQNYEMAFFSLEKTCEGINRNIQEIGQRLANKTQYSQDKTGVERDFMQLIEMRDICHLSILAKQKFYNESTTGKVAGFFQAAIGRLGLQSSIAKAEITLATCQTHIETLCKIDETLSLGLNYDELANQAHFMADLALMRTCAIAQEKDFYSTRGSSDRSPNQVLIAKPNGDVLVVDCKKPIEDGLEHGIYAYRATRYSIGHGPEHVTFVSSFAQSTAGETLNESNNLTRANNKIRRKEVLHAIGESMTINIDNIPYSFCLIANSEKPTEGIELDSIGEKFI